ncbi:MAG TPA: hypothetical protein VK624_17450 [Steroidobacteraceae bacterium]|nr:hypothetical protein [Steroidobacteraceae bacterium]
MPGTNRVAIAGSAEYHAEKCRGGGEVFMRALAVAGLLLAGVAMADEPAARIPAELRSCVAIKRNTERLACFDRGISSLLDLGKTAAQAVPSAESSFGLFAQAPTEAAIDQPARAQMETLEAHVKAIETAADGSAIIALDNDQTWRQISGSATLLLKVGDPVVIRRAALGSFQLATPNGRTGKVKRVR